MVLQLPRTSTTWRFECSWRALRSKLHFWNRCEPAIGRLCFSTFELLARPAPNMCVAEQHIVYSVQLKHMDGYNTNVPGGNTKLKIAIVLVAAVGIIIVSIQFHERPRGLPSLPPTSTWGLIVRLF